MIDRYRFELKGVSFKNNKEAQEYFGVGERAILRWKKEAGINTKVYKFELEGREFTSMAEATEFYGVSRRAISRWISKGIEVRKSPEVVIDDMIFKNREAAARHFGVHKMTISHWSKEGKSKYGTSIPFTLFGRKFKSLRDCAEYYGFTTATAWHWKFKSIEEKKKYEKDL